MFLNPPLRITGNYNGVLAVRGAQVHFPTEVYAFLNPPDSLGPPPRSFPDSLSRIPGRPPGPSLGPHPGLLHGPFRTFSETLSDALPMDTFKSEMQNCVQAITVRVPCLDDCVWTEWSSLLFAYGPCRSAFCLCTNHMAYAQGALCCIGSRLDQVVCAWIK